MVAGRDYRSRLYANYASGIAGDASDSRAGPTLKREVLPHLPRDRGARILDMGCGQGELIEMLRAEGYTRVDGVDVSPQQVELALRRGVEGIDEADLFEYLAAHQDTYDAIVAVDVVEHFDKEGVLEVLEAVATALAAQGRLVMRVPNAETPYAGRLRYADFTHGVAFTHHSVRQVLLACGFNRVEVGSTPPAAHSMKSLARLGLWKLIALQRKLVLAVETGLLRGHIVSQNLVAVAHRGS